MLLQRSPQNFPKYTKNSHFLQTVHNQSTLSCYLSKASLIDTSLYSCILSLIGWFLQSTTLPTNNTDYSCHIKTVELVYSNHTGTISHHIVPLIVTGPAKTNHVSTKITVTFSPISLVLNEVTRFCKLQKKTH